jgi:hypothetical protein
MHKSPLFYPGVVLRAGISQMLPKRERDNATSPPPDPKDQILCSPGEARVGQQYFKRDALNKVTVQGATVAHHDKVAARFSPVTMFPQLATETRRQITRSAKPASNRPSTSSRGGDHYHHTQGHPPRHPRDAEQDSKIIRTMPPDNNEKLIGMTAACWTQWAQIERITATSRPLPLAAMPPTLPGRRCPPPPPEIGDWGPPPPQIPTNRGGPPPPCHNKGLAQRCCRRW